MGESLGRWSLSSIVHQSRAKIWKPYLGPGENVIAIEARNFDSARRDRQGPDCSAGVNLYGEIVYQGGNVQKVFSDDHWVASNRHEEGWNKIKFNDRQWRNVFADPDRHYAVTKPDFVKNKPSWIVPGM